MFINDAEMSTFHFDLKYRNGFFLFGYAGIETKAKENVDSISAFK